MMNPMQASITGMEHVEADTPLGALSEFYRAFNKAIEMGTKPETRIEIVTPLIHMKKSEIVKKGAELGAPLRLTWSCYQASEKACGRCESCALRLKGFNEAGVKDPIPYEG